MGRDSAVPVGTITLTISIHAPRMGRDGLARGIAVTVVNFNPRAPYGARPIMYNKLRNMSEFQSTRPVWGATATGRHTAALWIISIHAPRMGRDRRPADRRLQAPNFNPRAPYGARLSPRCPHRATSADFNPRAPYGARLPGSGILSRPSRFQSTRPVWGATAKLHNFPVQFCARVTVNSMQQTIFGQSMPAASFKLQEHTRISGAKPPEKVCQLALRIQTISTPSGS